jgi:lipooligosaccharide transport system permease protein
MTAVALALPRGAALFERNARAHRRHFLIIFSGFFEPLFYLLSMGVGLGHYVGKVPGPNGELVSYASFIAPALLATAAMNGAMYDASSTFWKMKYMKLYDSVLATPLGPLDVAIGELSWALFRGMLYAITFLITVSVLGDVQSPWALLALPAALLVGFGFAGMGMAGATYMRSWQDFEFLNLVQLPLFLFSATFYPLSVYPHWLQIVVRCTPLYNAISLIRGLMLGALGPYQLVNAAYLVVFGAVGLTIARRRIGKLLLK